MAEPTPYKEAYPVGTEVRILGREFLEDFMANWKFHHPLRLEHLAYAGRVARVDEVGFYHGGDPVYKLADTPGLWLEQCLGNV